MIQIPKVLENSENYAALTEAQRVNFMARLNYVEEILGNIKTWLAGESEWDTLADFLDDLELDVAANQNPVAGDEFVSNWLIHSTWFDEHRPGELRAELSSEMVELVDLAPPALTSSDEAVGRWLEQQRRGLELALREFSTADSIKSVLSAILFLNIMLAGLLADLYRLRYR